LSIEDDGSGNPSPVKISLHPNKPTHQQGFASDARAVFQSRKGNINAANRTDNHTETSYWIHDLSRNSAVASASDASLFFRFRFKPVGFLSIHEP
jgi:hypothetical protein